jgi:AraC family transcriptional regulator
MLDRALCTLPYMGTSVLSLYKNAGPPLRHLGSQQFPMRMTLSHTQSRWRKVLVMDGHLGEALAVSNLGTTRSRAWMHRVIALVEAAIGQLHHQVHPAQDKLLEAASMLRQQIDPPAAREACDGGGRLLAWQVGKVRDYIDSHIAGPLLVADLCALIQRSEAHFSRSFKRTFGESPHSFVVRRRVDLAAQYMLITDAPLSDIALQCGFTDQAHLCKQFRQASGQTPAAWRRAHRPRHDEYIDKPPIGGIGKNLGFPQYSSACLTAPAETDGVRNARRQPRSDVPGGH